MVNPKVERWVFVGLVAVISLAFIYVLEPYLLPVFWGVILAILFEPLQQVLMRRTGGNATLVAMTTTVITVLVAIVPMIFITGLLVQEGASVYNRIQQGHLDVVSMLNQIKAALPDFLQRQIDKYNLSQPEKIQKILMDSLRQGSQFLANKAFSVGQGTADFLIGFGVMLYLLFFLLRDGHKLLATVHDNIPLRTAHKDLLFDKFTRVVQATVKGNLIVAIAQGFLGALIFWILSIPSALLWGVVMAFLSLLPAVGSGLIWGPVAIYLLATGSLWKGIILIAFGVGVIGLVDNLLRPLVVGKDTKLPDYLVLISTLGGMSLFGISGFVIGPVIAALFIASWGLFSQTANSLGEGGDSGQGKDKKLAPSSVDPVLAAPSQAQAEAAGDGDDKQNKDDSDA